MTEPSVIRLRDRLAPGAGPAGPIDLATLVGSWRNYDPASGGLVAIDIDQRAGDGDGTAASLVVPAFGGKPAGPVDWGEVAGAGFAAGVGGREAVGFTAGYDLGFVDVLLAAYLNKRLLVVDSYARFRPDDRRSPYFQRDHFYLP